MLRIDLRSDTVTQPTQRMRQAMMQTEVGDDGQASLNGFGEDPTVNQLEALAAEMLGKERGLLVPSGTMGNLIAVMTRCRRGERVVVGQDAHVYRTEKAAFMDDLLGRVPVIIPENEGRLDVDLLEEALKSQSIGLICVENSHNYAGGLVLPVEYLQKVKALADAHGVAVHMDGARIFNAAVTLGIDAKEIAGYADTVMFCLSKGLSAPIGSILCGPKEFILSARKGRKLIGGQMRQAGIIAAAGIEALKTMVFRLKEDHLKARVLTQDLRYNCEMPIPANIHTNMFKFDVSTLGMTAQTFHDELAKRGVLVHVFSPTEIRIVTHKDVSMDECRSAAKIIGSFWNECYHRSQ